MRHNLLLPTIALLLAFPLAGRAAGDAPLFDAIDTDKSGTLSMEEFVKSPLASLETPAGKKLVPFSTPKSKQLSNADKQRLFKQLDKDKNGSIDRKEWKHASPDGFVLFRF